MASPLQVNFDIKGLNRVQNRLRAAAAFHTKTTDLIIEKHAKREAAFMRQKQYPPELPNQVYQRTFVLQRSFRAQKEKPGQWRVINRAKKDGREYAVWVIKKGMQSTKFWGRPAGNRSHAARWWTIEDTLQKRMPDLTKALSVALVDLMEREGKE